MIHARKDYNRRIQDSENLIGIDEPVFLLRAKDEQALPTLHFYLARLSIGNDETAREGTRRQIDRMAKWKKVNPSKMHNPDCPPEELVLE